MTPAGLARHIRRLSPNGPISVSLEAALAARHSRLKRTWYTTQRQHLLGWLRDYDGPGYYNRKTWGGRSAEYVYNHFKCAPGLLWLAEAAGVPRGNLLKARRGVMAATRNPNVQCAALRVIIPWSSIERHLTR